MSDRSAAWIAIGLLIGAYVNYLITAPRLRVYSEVAQDSITLPDFFSNRFKDEKNILKIVCGSVIIIFFAVYTASGSSGAIAAISTGAITVILWVYVFDTFGTDLYSIIPGFILSMIAGIVVSLITQNEITEEMQHEFSETTRIVREK